MYTISQMYKIHNNFTHCGWRVLVLEEGAYSLNNRAVYRLHTALPWHQHEWKGKGPSSEEDTLGEDPSADHKQPYSVKYRLAFLLI